MIEGGWNPYFVAFAHAHGCTPEAMVRGPRIAARYLTWIPGEWLEFFAAAGITPSHPFSRVEAEFGAWLAERWPAPASEVAP